MTIFCSILTSVQYSWKIAFSIKKQHKMGFLEGSINQENLPASIICLFGELSIKKIYSICIIFLIQYMVSFDQTFWSHSIQYVKSKAYRISILVDFILMFLTLLLLSCSTVLEVCGSALDCIPNNGVEMVVNYCM